MILLIELQRGIPVATVAINNSTNAALLAIRILGSSDLAIQKEMNEYLVSIGEEVEQKREKMAEVGWMEYKGL